MGKKFTPRSVLYYVLMSWQYIGGITAAVLTYASAQDKAKWTGIMLAGQVIDAGKEFKIYTFIMIATSVVAKVVCDRMGPPWAWQAVQKILDNWKTGIFPGTPDNEHRITIFKHTSKWYSLIKWSVFKRLMGPVSMFKRSQWPDGWFKPIARSGNVSQRNISWFPCFDNAKNEEGFIGIVWRNPDAVTLNGLPDLDVTTTPSAAEYALYSSNTKVPVTWLQARRGGVNARSFCGIRIELDGGGYWGVIIIDSRDPALDIAKSEMRLAALALGKFVRKA